MEENNKSEQLAEVKNEVFIKLGTHPFSSGLDKFQNQLSSANKGEAELKLIQEEVTEALASAKELKVITTDGEQFHFRGSILGKLYVETYSLVYNGTFGPILIPLAAIEEISFPE